MKFLDRLLPQDNPPSGQEIRPPSNQDLSALLDKVIFEWCKLPVVPAGRPAQGPARLDLEYSVKLQGQNSGHLVLRSPLDLAAELAHAATGDPGARGNAKDAFRDLCCQVASRLVGGPLGADSQAFPGHQPQPSRPEQWPQREPESESVVLVGYWPLEARLWVEKPAARPEGAVS